MIRQTLVAFLFFVPIVVAMISNETAEDITRKLCGYFQESTPRKEMDFLQKIRTLQGGCENDARIAEYLACSAEDPTAHKNHSHRFLKSLISAEETDYLWQQFQHESFEKWREITLGMLEHMRTQKYSKEKVCAIIALLHAAPVRTGCHYTLFFPPEKPEEENYITCIGMSMDSKTPSQWLRKEQFSIATINKLINKI